MSLCVMFLHESAMKKMIHDILLGQRRVFDKRVLILGGLFFSVLVIAIAYNQSDALRQKKSASVEVGFSSFSPNGPLGGEIIPASCESTPEASWDHRHNRPVEEIKELPDGQLGAAVPGHSYRVTINSGSSANLCFSSDAAFTLAVPTNTFAEFDTFWGNFLRWPGFCYLFSDNTSTCY